MCTNTPTQTHIHTTHTVNIHKREKEKNFKPATWGLVPSLHTSALDGTRRRETGKRENRKRTGPERGQGFTQKRTVKGTGETQSSLPLPWPLLVTEQQASLQNVPHTAESLLPSSALHNFPSPFSSRHKLPSPANPRLPCPPGPPPRARKTAGRDNGQGARLWIRDDYLGVPRGGEGPPAWGSQDQGPGRGP